MSNIGISRRAVLAAGTATAAVAATGLATAAPAMAGSAKRKVLVIGVDGLRFEKFSSGLTPTLTAMMGEGTYGTSLLYANPLAPTNSGPGWSTISTGVWPDKHKVVDNAFAGSRYDLYPGFLSRIARIRPELVTYYALDWSPLDTHGCFADADSKLVLDGDYAKNDATIADAAERLLRDEDPDVLFVYFGNPDVVGHNTDTTGQAYLDAVARTDGYIGRLRAALAARPGAADEEWTVIVTTDHGHVPAGGHGGNTIEERRVFVLATGPGIPAGARPVDTRLVDVAPTVFHALNIPIPPAWNLDGRPLQTRSYDAFDALYPALAGRVDETDIPAGTLGFTHKPPQGWSVVNNAMGTGGVTEWRGWSFTTDEFWTRAERGQWRELNIRSRGVFAVADSDEWADKTFSGTFDSTLVGPAHDVAGKKRVTLAYTTLYRQEGAQTAEVLASFDGGTPIVVHRHQADVLSQRQSVTVDVPRGAATVSFSFRYTGSNNWYWAIDGVKVNAR